MACELDRRQFLAASAATALAGGGSDQVSYLLIVPDQLTWWMTDPAQRGLLDLPNVDRLRREGTVFERCYSTSPLCKPVRFSLRTGMWPHTNPAVNLVYPIETVEERMQQRGYVTRYVGKWHLSPDSTGQYVEPQNRLHWKYFVGHEYDHSKFETYVMNDRTPVPTGEWDSGVMTDFAIRQMRSDAAAGRPFFMQLNYLPPHQPYNVYPSWLKTYTTADVTLRPNVPIPTGGFGVPGYTIKPKTRIKDYMNLTSGVDLELGRILNEVDALGIDVVVIFTSDHGDMLWSQGMEYKCKPWEESARVPLIVRGPGWPARTVRYPVGLVDLARTLAGLGQGIDLRDDRDSVYYELANGGQSPSWLGDYWRALVTDDGWKLAVSVQGPRLLYDLVNDPYELVNLAGQGHPQEGELYARLREWARETLDPFVA